MRCRAAEWAALAALGRCAGEGERLAAGKVCVLSFWRQVAGRYAYQLRCAGHEPDPPNPIPPNLIPLAQRGDRSSWG